MDQKGFTKIRINQINYLWTIDNCELGLDLIANGYSITSDRFTDKNKSVWYLELKKNICIDEEAVTVYAYLEKCNKVEFKTIYKFSIINNKGEKANTFKCVGIPLMRKDLRLTGVTIRTENLLKSENNLLCNDQLKILCEITVLDDILSDNSTPEFNMPNCKLYEDFSIVFESKKFSDVTLTVADGRQFRVHKLILATNSSVFAAMFEHEMEETKHNNVNINDMDYEVLQEVLRFMYTGKIQNLQDMAREILAAADKYAVEALKVVCEKKLDENLSIENATEMLVLSYRHRAEQLKMKVIYFIKTNPDVMETKEWKELKESHLFVDLFEAMAINK